MIPAVAVRDFVAAIGGAVAHRAILRNDQVTGAVSGPGASVSMHAPGSACLMGLGERQDAFDDRPVIVMGVVAALAYPSREKKRPERARPRPSHRARKPRRRLSRRRRRLAADPGAVSEAYPKADPGVVIE